MSTVTEKPAETIPTTEEVAILKYAGYKSVNGMMVAEDFTLPGFESRIAKWMASDPELVRFRAEARDEREIRNLLINEVNDNQLVRPFHGLPISSCDFDAEPGGWIAFIPTVGLVPRPSTVKWYHKEMARRKEAAEAAARPTPLSQTIVKTLSKYRSDRQREMWTRLHQLIADASSKGLSEFVLAELATVADQLELTDEKVAREFEAFEARG